MRFVGIENSRFKREMVSLASQVGKIVTLALPSVTAKDCNRHFELLKLFDKNVRDYSHTEYWKFNLSNKKKKNDITKKIERFNHLYKLIKENGYDYNKGYIILTEDGARLDGSHRGSIIEHLRYKKIDVLMTKWEDVFKPKELIDLYNHIAFQKAKYI